MPRVNIYVDEELHQQLKTVQVQTSTVCQRALAEEVRLRLALTNLDDDVRPIVERLWETKKNDDADRYARGFAFGTEWAKRIARYDELKYFAWRNRDEPPDTWWLQEDHTLRLMLIEQEIEAGGSPSPDAWDNLDDSRPYQRGVIEGAFAVWKAVWPALSEIERATEGDS